MKIWVLEHCTKCGASLSSGPWARAQLGAHEAGSGSEDLTTSSSFNAAMHAANNDLQGQPEQHWEGTG